MTETTTPIRAGRREWTGLAVISLPCLLYSMDLTVLNLALPRLSEELAPSSAQLLWIVDVYGFLVAGFLVTMGNLGDRIGRRRLLLLGATAFGAASVLAAFATSAGMLIAARAVLGVAGATLAPSTLSLIRNMFHDPRQRTTAIGVWATSFSVGGALGPVLGGVLLQHFWWGSVFLLAVPVMALLLAVGPVLLPEYRDPGASRLDPWSVALSLASILPVIYGMKAWAEGGAPGRSAAAVAAGLAVGIAFVRRQRRLVDPLVDLRLFRVPAFAASLATFTLTTAVVFGMYVFVGQHLQLVAGLSPMEAGLWMLPGSAGVIAGSMLAPAIVRRFAPAWVMGGGLVLAAAGFAILTQAGALGLAGLVAGNAITSLGLGPVFTLGTDLVVGSAPPRRAGAAAAMSETSSELGGALGIAVLGSVGTMVYRAALAAAPLAGIPPEAREAARRTLGGATAAAAALPGALGAELAAVARAAFTDALELTAAICAVVAAATAVLAISVLGRRRPGAPAAEPEPRGAAHAPGDAPRSAPGDGQRYPVASAGRPASCTSTR